MAQQSQTTNPFGSSLDGIMKANANNMENIAQSYGTFLHKLGRLNAETMSFCAERWKEDMEVSAKIARSKAPEDVAEAYSGFFMKMFNDYSEQAQRVIDTMGDLGNGQGGSDDAQSSEAQSNGSSRKAK
ncbi:phasin family protein [Hoeflea sp.]|uniref:phasin family protein n=1 Tax=Hoeflea sp. TaxID=1940281 RepID=UPI003B015F21